MFSLFPNFSQVQGELGVSFDLVSLFLFLFVTFVDFGGFEVRFVLAGLCQMFFKLHYLAVILLSAVRLDV